METILDIGRAVLAIGFTFSVAIFVHELGHFMFAKLFGVHVDTFSLGFGRPIWQRKWGTTVYQVAILPFGGYVKMSGLLSKEVEDLLSEDDEKPTEGGEADAAEKEKRTLTESVVEEIDALRSKPYWQRVLVLSAGCINNLLTAVVVYFFLIWIGHHGATPIRPVIEFVEPAVAGFLPIQPGDEFVRVGDEPVATLGDLFGQLADQFNDPSKSSVAALVVRDGTTISLTLPAELVPGELPDGAKIVEMGGYRVRGESDAADIALGLLQTTETVNIVVEKDGERTSLEMHPASVFARRWFVDVVDYERPAFIGQTLPNLPAEKAGLGHADVIVVVDGIRVSTAGGATRLIRERAGKETQLEYVKGTGRDIGTTAVAVVSVRKDPDNPMLRGQIGVVWATPLTEWRQEAFLPAVAHAFTRTGDRIVAYLQALKELTTKSFQSVRENVGGPIMIGVMVTKAAERGLVWFFELFALFNIILAVTNLLPIPILDGGHIVFATIESIIRRPLPGRMVLGVHNVFLVLLIGLAVLITFNDVIMNAWRTGLKFW